MKTKAFIRCKDAVLESFTALTSGRKVFRQKDLADFLQKHIGVWGIRQNTSTFELIEFLSTNHAIQTIKLTSESDYGAIKRFATPDASPFEIALSLRQHSYLSHATAVFLHGLTDQIPQTIYVNAEQSMKPKPLGPLTQAGIDRAFRSHQRASRYIFVYGRNRYVILSGKHTERHGVITVELTPGEKLQTTDLERTLIDVTVRPTYGGGVHEVLAAFRSALPRISFSRLLATLRHLDYLYPYHQALGFYLERAGATANRLERLRALGIEFNFYLTHGLKNPALDPSWRIYSPKVL